MALSFGTYMTAELCNAQENLQAYQRMGSQVPKTKEHGQKREWGMIEIRVPYQGPIFIESESERL